MAFKDAENRDSKGSRFFLCLIVKQLQKKCQKAAVQALMKERGLPDNFTGTIDYHGFKIRVQRPTSYTWEQNNQIQDDNLTYYKNLHTCYEQIQKDAKELRADLKRTAEKLADRYPNSASIKYGFTIALLA